MGLQIRQSNMQAPFLLPWVIASLLFSPEMFCVAFQESHFYFNWQELTDCIHLYFTHFWKWLITDFITVTLIFNNVLNRIISEITTNKKDKLENDFVCHANPSACASLWQTPHAFWRRWPFTYRTCPSYIIDDLKFSALPHPVRLKPVRAAV